MFFFFYQRSWKMSSLPCNTIDSLHHQTPRRAKRNIFPPIQSLLSHYLKCGSNLRGDKMGLDADPTFYRSHRSKAENSSPLWHFCTWLKAMAAQSAYQAFDFTMFKVISYKHCAILWKLVSKYFWIFTRIKKRKSIVDQWVIFEDNCVMLGIRS